MRRAMRRCERSGRRGRRSVRAGGIIALHDTQTPPGDGGREQSSVRYAREVVLKDERFEVLETVDLLTVLRRRAIR